MHSYRRYLDTVDLNVVPEQHGGLVNYAFRVQGARKLQLSQCNVERERRSKGGFANYNDTDATQSPPSR